MKPIAENSTEKRIIEEELRLLARVSSTLTTLSTRHAGAPDYDAELISLRDQLADAKPEDLAPIVEQMTRISALAQNYGKGRDLPIDPRSPYFAHMRLHEEDRRRDVLIGKRSFIDRPSGIQIVDWRHAPVSRIYYRYDEGDDYDETFGTKSIQGHVEFRRNVTIQNATLLRIGYQDTVLTVDGTGTWFAHESQGKHLLKGGQGKASRPPTIVRGSSKSQLGVGHQPTYHADKHLPEIAALIDPTQFELISQPHSGVVILQGGAGTGKTTVALHRIAFLNFAYPKLFRPETILVIVPTQALARYVNQVLPSLGVHGVRIDTAHSWFEHTRHKVLPHTSKRYCDDTPSTVVRLKKHPLLLRLFQEEVAAQTARINADIETLLDEQNQFQEEWRRAWHTTTHLPLVTRLRKLITFVIEHTALSLVLRQRLESDLRTKLRRARDVVRDWAEILTDRKRISESVDRFYPHAFSAHEIEQTCRWCAEQSEEVEPVENDPDLNETYRSVDGHDERLLTRAGKFDAADDGLLLYLAILKEGQLSVSSNKRIGFEHIVVDEAQDLSAIELKVLFEIASKRKSMTLAGDPVQRIVFDNSFSSWEERLRELQMTVTANTTLKLGYRSTEEVMSLAQSFVENESGSSTWLAQRSGAPVELHQVSDHGEAVAFLVDALRSVIQREPLASICLITRHRAQAAMYAEALTHAEVPNIRRVLNHDFSFKPGIDVTDVSQVKGLEFDYVIVLDVSATTYHRSQECRHLLHIAVTRAAHQLWLISVGTPSPLLPTSLLPTDSIRSKR